MLKAERRETGDSRRTPAMCRSLSTARFSRPTTCARDTLFSLSLLIPCDTAISLVRPIPGAPPIPSNTTIELYVYVHPKPTPRVVVYCTLLFYFYKRLGLLGGLGPTPNTPVFSPKPFLQPFRTHCTVYLLYLPSAAPILRPLLRPSFAPSPLHVRYARVVSVLSPLSAVEEDHVHS